MISFLFCLHQEGNARQDTNYEEGFRFGASMNYGRIYFESDGSFLNDLWKPSPGYQFHILYEYHVSNVFSVSSGIGIFVHRYRFEEQRTPETDSMGNPTGFFATLSMRNTVGTTYLQLPLHLAMRPFANKSLYVTAGPDLALKLSHKNGTLVSRSDSSHENPILFEDLYNTPERSNVVLFFINVGIGYSLDSRVLPMNIHLGAKQSITPYMDGDNFLTSRIRNISVTFSYRL